MEALVNRLLEFISRSRFRWYSGAVAGLLATLGLLTSLEESLPEGWERWVIGSCLFAAVWCIWRLVFRIPRARKGRIGFVVAIQCDSEAHEKSVRVDFIERMRSHLLTDQRVQFDLIEYPRALAERVVDPESAALHRRKSRSHFIVYGRVRERELDGGTSGHIVTLDANVAFIEQDETSRPLINDELADVLPGKFKFKRENSFLHFEAASEWFDVATRYIVGIAALVSGDARTAETLLLSAEDRLTRMTTVPNTFRKVVKRLPENLRTLYTNWLAYVAEEFRVKRNPDLLPLADEICDKIIDRWPNDHGTLMMKAICEFMLRGDIAQARRWLNQSPNRKDPTPNLNRAFLLAYEGKLGQATVEYEKAFRKSTDDITLGIQCEDFIQAVLSQDPTHVELYYCLGIINERLKGDRVAAFGDYKRFLELADPTKYDNERTTAAAFVGAESSSQSAGRP